LKAGSNKEPKAMMKQTMFDNVTFDLSISTDY